MAKQTILDRIQTLEQNVISLNTFREKISVEELKKKKFIEWALRYGFIESIQIIIDVSCYMVSYYNLGKPSTYSDCIELIAKYNYINQTTKEKLIGMIGLRNLLIHEYSTIDIEILYGLLENVNDVNEFIKNLKPYIID